jgi:RNA polymerase sigma-70 factor (ECF subfamily)
VEEPAGDPQTDEFDVWYSSSAPRLVATLTVVCGDPEVAADAAAEAFVRAYERWRRVSRMEHRDAWLFRVAQNILRRQARRSALERRHAARWAERPADAPELRIELWRAVGELSHRQREAIGLRYVLGLSQREVAAAMGVAEGTAAATLAHARQRLASLIDAMPEQPEGVER